jgi:hypothetical protein
LDETFDSDGALDDTLSVQNSKPVVKFIRALLITGLKWRQRNNASIYVQDVTGCFYKTLGER